MIILLCITAVLAAISPNGVSAISATGGELNVCKESNSYVSIDGSCDWYIVCKEYAPHNEMCPDGLNFDPTTKYPDNPCKFPADMPCSSRMSQKPKPTAECPRQYGFFESISGSKRDCGKYRLCKEGRATVKSCPIGYVFNPVNARCDFPDNVPSCRVEISSIPQLTIPVAAPTVPPTSQPKKIIVEQPAPTKNWWYHPTQYSTTTDYSFLNPSVVPTPVNSRPVAYRNPIISTVRPWYTQRTAAPTNPPPMTVATYKPPVRPMYPEPAVNSRTMNQLYDNKCEGPNGYYSVANQCDVYIECKNYTAVQRACFDGLHYNPSAVWPEFPCAYPSEVQCDSQAAVNSAQPTSECPRRYGRFPSSNNDCGKYIECEAGRAIVRDCAPGLVFNPKISICDYEINVPECQLDVFRGFTCPAAPLGEDDFIYKYKFENSCRKFIACQEGYPRLLSCNTGLSFDEKTESCVKSQLVTDCVD